MLRNLCRPLRTTRFNTRTNALTSFTRNASWKNEGKTDDKIQFKWFLLIGVFGTMVYVTVMQRIQEQDHSKNLEKYKKTFTEEEWAQYINEIQKKHLTLEHNEECYLVPFANNENVSNNKSIAKLYDNLGSKDYVSVLDLNELVNDQINDPLKLAKYHILLSQTLETVDEKALGFKYSFSYKLKPGIFTQIINDEILKIKEQSPQMGRFIILNYPPNIKEAIKFEQNISNKDSLVKLDENHNDKDIIQYFETVDKVVNVNNVQKLSPLIIDVDTKPVVTKPIVEQTFELKTLPTTEPSKDAPVIQKAQYKLRQLNQPIRYYGESDEDVINRLSQIQK